MGNNFYKYEVLGFPVFIVNPVFKDISGERYLDIDHGKFMKNVFKALTHKKTRISGAELKFIRKYMKMTQDDLVRIVFDNEIDRSVVSRWESKKNGTSGMSFSQETMLRMRMAVYLSDRLSIKTFTERVSDSFKSCTGAGQPMHLEFKDVA